MSKDFVPITVPDAIPRPSTSFRLKVLPSQEGSSFSPAAAQPANVISLSIPGGPKPPAAAAPARAEHDHGLPTVQLQREGDKITGIQITCSCGGLIKLDCVY